MSEEVKNMNETKPETATKETAAPVETMADYEDAINASLKPIHEGDILTGEVIGVSEDTVTLDLGSFTDGIIRLEDASDDPNFTFNEIQVGQTISATVIRRDDGEGHILLSMKEAVRLRFIRQIQRQRRLSRLIRTVSCCPTAPETPRTAVPSSTRCGSSMRAISRFLPSVWGIS